MATAPRRSRTASDNSPTRRADAKHVVIQELSRGESEALLTKHHVGRLGISFHDRVRVELANYVYHEGWIYARTEHGSDLASMQHHPWAAFEVDEIDGMYDWRTVEVSGSIELIAKGSAFTRSSIFETAVQLMRAVVPAVLTSDDPIPERVQILRIHVDEIRGRDARSGTAVESAGA
jgi:uncharacterized protein